MNYDEGTEYCDVIGCRKRAALVQTEANIENEEWLCEACYHNLKLSRPDVASYYRRIHNPSSDVDHDSHSKHT